MKLGKVAQIAEAVKTVNSVNNVSFVTVVTSLLMFATLGASAGDIKPYLVGDLEALTVKSEPVQVSDMKVEAPYDGTEKNILRLGAKEGKALVITFYNRDCLACRAHLRSLEALQRNLGINTVEVIALHVGKGGMQEAERTLARWGLEGLAAYEPHHQSIIRDFSMDPDFQRNGTGPMSVIVGPDGFVRATSYHLREWEAPETVNFFKALARGDV
ncbi:thioredoxin domain-containing protein [Kordiimonas aestuarii]|uniref:redoxin domain-containing protein n=1 Tax=Kordiimonas aestuarii TaxID=1005925 RepID=UPI0021CFA358|nr:redoxin domain-containing protein [Kordiimonas aestuarii]